MSSCVLDEVHEVLLGVDVHLVVDAADVRLGGALRDAQRVAHV